MTTPQLPLFDQEIALERVGRGARPSRGAARSRAPYQKSSDTSKAAAEYVKPHLQRMETIVLDAILLICATGKRGATVFDVMRWTGLDKDNVAPRFTSMKDRGLIQKTEKRLSHPERPGSMTLAWAWEVIA